MTYNLNTGSMNNSLSGITDHAGSMAGGITIYFRNRSVDTSIEFIHGGNNARLFEWFTTTDSKTTFVKKPPVPIVAPGTTSSAIFYSTAAAPLSLNTIRFRLNEEMYWMEWKFNGFRRLLNQDNTFVEVENEHYCIGVQLNKYIMLTCLSGRGVWVIEIVSILDILSEKIDFAL